jgi:hypothetical protein
MVKDSGYISKDIVNRLDGEVKTCRYYTAMKMRETFARRI